jgi:hypothetical protein
MADRIDEMIKEERKFVHAIAPLLNHLAGQLRSAENDAKGLYLRGEIKRVARNEQRRGHIGIYRRELRKAKREVRAILSGGPSIPKPKRPVKMTPKRTKAARA